MDEMLYESGSHISSMSKEVTLSGCITVLKKVIGDNLLKMPSPVAKRQCIVVRALVQLLLELASRQPLGRYVGIDGRYFIYRFGTALTERCIHTLMCCYTRDGITQP
jgi:hypothetical protein